MSEATTPANTTDQIAATTAYDWGYDDSDGTDETCFVLGRKTDRGFEILAQVYGDGGKHLAAYIERLEAERDALLAEHEAWTKWREGEQSTSRNDWNRLTNAHDNAERVIHDE